MQIFRKPQKAQQSWRGPFGVTWVRATGDDLPHVHAVARRLESLRGLRGLIKQVRERFRKKSGADTL